MGKGIPEATTASLAVRLLLLLMPPMIAVLLYLDGQVYSPDLLELGQAGTSTAAPANLFPARLAGMDRAGPVRRFDKENLYEYINGHAEYFIGAGFRGLAVGEFGADGDGQPRLVVNLYDLGNALNAFGVLVNEVGNQESAEVGALGFGGSQGLNFVRGPFYVQLSLYDPALDPLAAAREMDARLARHAGNSDLAFHFPALGRATATRYVREYYHGMDFLNGVLERSFERDGETLRAFLVVASETAIRDLTFALERFLDDEGIEAVPVTRHGMKFVTVADPYEGEWFYVDLKHRFLGVYASLDDGLAADVAEFADGLTASPPP
jgi:hypothetical protein